MLATLNDYKFYFFHWFISPLILSLSQAEKYTNPITVSSQQFVLISVNLDFFFKTLEILYEKVGREE